MLNSVAAQVIVALLAVVVPLVLYRTRKYTRRAMYIVKAIKDRHKPMDDSVWEEKDLEVLLMRVVCKTSRSMGVTFMMWPERQFRGTLLGFLYFRIIDTLADDIEGIENKKAAMTSFLDRLDVLKNATTSPGPFDVSKYNIFTITQKQRSYKLIVENLHRFDDIFFQLSDKDKKTVYEYSRELLLGNIRIVDSNGSSRFQDECYVALEIGLTYGLLPIFDLQEVSDHIKDGVTKEGKAWKSWATAMCFAQMVSTIEADLDENICFDDDLLPFLGKGTEVDADVVAKVRSRMLTKGLEHYCQTLPFFFYEPAMKPIGLRLMFLQFTMVALNSYEREMAKVGLVPKRKINVWKVMFISTLQSVWSLDSYKKSMMKEIERAKSLLTIAETKTS